MRFWDNTFFWRAAAGALATLSLALLVAAIITRDPADFSAAPIIAVIRDREQHPVWEIRLARAAHQIAVDSIRVEPTTIGRVYHLWLLDPEAASPHQLGLLPLSGRKRIAVSPGTARQLTGPGELIVTLEPSGGSRAPAPSGPTVLRGTLEGLN